MAFEHLGLVRTQLTLLGRFRRAIRAQSSRSGEGTSGARDRVFVNLDRDPQIPDRPAAGAPASRLELVETLHRAGTQDLAELKAEGTRFCRGNRLRGAELPCPELGHVHTLDALADWLYGAEEELSIDETKAWLRDLARLPLDETACLEVQKSEIGGRLEASERTGLSPHVVWSFFEDGDSRPFSRLRPRRSELINRLGLGHLEDSAANELLFWTHRLPAGRVARRPTAWDAGLRNPWWRPTGRTEPLDGSGADDGLPEAVHDPVGVAELVTPIRGADPR